MRERGEAGVVDDCAVIGELELMVQGLIYESQKRQSGAEWRQLRLAGYWLFTVYLNSLKLAIGVWTLGNQASLDFPKS